MPVTKIAISVPKDLLDQVESVRRRKGLTRSAVVESGLRAWLRAQRDAERVRAYVEAYRRHPESEDEVAEAAAIVRASLDVGGDD
jgi:metal-responsive CopG/Arc/MetJ family transcriptional regulator